MANAMKIYQTGGPEVMKWEVYDPGSPAEGEVLLRQTTVGLNYIDVYFRMGIYPAPQYPFVNGLEGAGVVEEVGIGVEDLAVGDRVAYANPPLGAYCDFRVMPAHRLVKMPDSISDETAAAMMLQGLTVHYLLNSCFEVKKGDTILFHAAAGGVGLIACQWAKTLGAKTIGTVGSDEKAEIAREHGCDYPVVYTREDFVQQVQEITNGAGVPVVYDSVGASTFHKSLDCLSPRGLLVSFGQASGEVEEFNPGVLREKGSLYLTRPTLMTYTAKREDLVNRTEDLCSLVSSGQVKITVNQRYALSDAAQAHRDLEARKTQGSTVLVV